MRTRIVVILLFISSCYPVFAQDLNLIWNNANDAYRQSRFVEADSLYRFIYNLGKESSELYYNIGNCAVKKNNIAEAILWYERALLLSPSNVDIEHNLRFANALKIDKITPPTEFFIQRYWTSIANWATSSQWAFITLSFFFLLLSSIFAFIITQHKTAKRWILSAVIILIIFNVLTFALGSHKNTEEHHSGAAIIFSHVIKVKSMPSETSTDLFTLHEGTKVFIKDRLSDWIEVETYGDIRGWIPKSSVQEI